MAAAKDTDKNPPVEQMEVKPRVRIVGDGTVGHLLLKKGDITEDAEYVALLESKRGRTLVEKAN